MKKIWKINKSINIDGDIYPENSLLFKEDKENYFILHKDKTFDDGDDAYLYIGKIKEFQEVLKELGQNKTELIYCNES